MTKAELIEMLRVAKHNQDVLEDAIDQIDKNIKDWVPVRHGRWVAIGADKRGRGGIFRCSSCNKTYPFICSYCPNCGAKMDEGENGNEQ